MTHRLRYTVALTVRSPFLFRGLEGSGFGIDTPHLRDEDGRPIVPADQVRGVLKEALSDLVGTATTESEIAALFGVGSGEAPGDAGQTDEPRRGLLMFGDLVAEGPLPATGETTRVAIDEETGAAKHGALQVIELVAPFGQAVRFTGPLTLFKPEGEGQRYERLFNQALALVASIGAFKSPGFGEVVPDPAAIKFDGARPLALPPASAAPEAERVRLRMTFDRPFLVDGEKIAANAVFGSPIVPGAVVKGALAERLRRAGQDTRTGALGAALAALSVSHAFPESETPGQPYDLPLPLSLVARKNGDDFQVGDALMLEDGKGAAIDGKPALFQTDWKGSDFTTVADRLRCPRGETPPGLPRTHTAIAAETGTADDQKLFTTIARSVRKDGTDRSWLIDIDRGRVPAGAERGYADALVAALLADGLEGIGKTAAHATFEVVQDTPHPAPRPIHGTANEYAVVLTTAALMLDARSLTTADGAWAMEPRQAYAAYWARAVEGATMTGFFAAQAFRGGYLARRRRVHGGRVYHPFLLTEPGSVFRIRVPDPARLADLCRYGLPLPPVPEGRPPLTWENCPYVPENGYGRIAADHLSTADLFALTGTVTGV